VYACMQCVGGCSGVHGVCVCVCVCIAYYVNDNL